MQHRIVIEGEPRDIDIRAMDESFIVYRKMYVAPLTPDNIGKVNPGDWAEHLEKFQRNGWQRLIEEFLRKHIRRIGSCAVLAWDGEGVIGKMYFTTREMWDAFRAADCCFCIEHESMPKFIQSLSDERMEALLASPGRTLQILCFNIGHGDERYHGQGIAKGMVEYLKQWARERGWRRLIMESCPDIMPDTLLGDHVLRRGAFERLGFRVLEDSQVPPEEGARRLSEIEAFLAGKKDIPKWARRYAGNVERLAADPVWRSEYDKDYAMACDL